MSTPDELLNSSELVRADGAAVRLLTLNRPETRNALDRELHRAVLAAIRAAAGDPDVRAIVVTGAGSAFSAGGDFTLIHQMQDDPNARRETFETARSLFRAAVGLPVPLIAAVNGPAVGAGCSLALLADVVFMADSTFLADPRVAIGLVSGDGGAVLWPMVAGLPAARAYLLTGDRLPAAEAHRLGLVYRLARPEHVLDDAIAFAERLAAMPKFAVSATKRALNRHLDAPIESAFEFALAAEAESLDTPEHRALTRAGEREDRHP